MEIRSNETKVYLRTLTMVDTDMLAEVTNEEDISYNMADFSRVPYPFTRRDALALIGLATNAQMDNSALHFGILAERVMVGAMVVKLDLKNKTGDIGYWIGKSHRRKGYARDAVKLVLSFAFGTLRFNRIQAKTLASNEASTRLLEGVGFIREGVRRQRLYIKGSFVDDVIFSMLGSEFEKKVAYDVKE